MDNWFVMHDRTYEKKPEFQHFLWENNPGTIYHRSWSGFWDSFSAPILSRKIGAGERVYLESRVQCSLVPRLFFDLSNADDE